MTLTSFTFLLFFPIVFLLQYLLFSKNRNLQNGFVLAASMVFYGWWDWRLLGFLLLTAISTYLAGIQLTASTLNLILPVGISFYTFSALSYSIDVYQQKSNTR